MAAQARLEAGQLELRRSRYVAAERQFLEALKLDPKAVKARRELVYIYGMQLRRPELNATFRALAEISAADLLRGLPLVPDPRGELGGVRDRRDPAEVPRGRPEPTAGPGSGWPRGSASCAGSTRPRRPWPPCPNPTPPARAARVRIALDRGDDQAAESLLAGGPADDLDLALLRGRFALARGDGPEAVRQFRIAYDKAPNLREAVLGLGQALKTTGDLAAAAPLLEEARKHERLGSLVQKAAVEKNRDDPALMRDLGEACAASAASPRPGPGTTWPSPETPSTSRPRTASPA